MARETGHAQLFRELVGVLSPASLTMFVDLHELSWVGL